MTLPLPVKEISLAAVAPLVPLAVPHSCAAQATLGNREPVSAEATRLLNVRLDAAVPGVPAAPLFVVPP